MIFVCVGSREYQFNRLLKEIDILIESNLIQEDVFAQIGQSTYIPKNFNYERFLSVEDFKFYQRSATLIISHGGTGALIGALKMNKQVIAVPRLEKYREHTDNHQLQVSSVLEEAGYLKTVIEIKDLYDEISIIKKSPITKQYDRPSNVLKIINEYITSQ